MIKSVSVELPKLARGLGLDCGRPFAVVEQGKLSKDVRLLVNLELSHLAANNFCAIEFAALDYVDTVAVSAFLNYHSANLIVDCL